VYQHQHNRRSYFFLSESDPGVAEQWLEASSLIPLGLVWSKREKQIVLPHQIVLLQVCAPSHHAILVGELRLPTLCAAL
jgi:hypothetical protein